ncbi:hypothetical protein Ga0100231_002550 [Opitutaceae bacterium TAV4]|nr:hypothetical protein Ga0100231_002550 [Opitutaceae bacterium TAV4]RRK01821.1 hypothetical protein Ga0100230_000690 [Opitutaceae bacterium TAV3]
MNNQYTHIKALAIVSAFGLISSAAHAALTINENNIVNNEYTYSIVTAGTVGAEAVKINGVTVVSPTSPTNPLARMREDVLARPNADFRRDGNYFLVSPNSGTTAASITYKFDFTDAGYYINTVTFSDSLQTFNSNGTVRTEYSLTGVDGSWVTLKTINRATSSTGYSANPAISLSSLTSTIYYRVSFAAGESLTLGTQQQWGRTNMTTSAEAFKAAFTLTPSVPEPETWTLFAGIVSAGIILVRLIIVRRDKAQRMG